jgi:hypothetical protein
VRIQEVGTNETLPCEKKTNPSGDRAFLGDTKDVTSLAGTALQSETQYADTLLGN